MNWRCEQWKRATSEGCPWFGTRCDEWWCFLAKKALHRPSEDCLYPAECLAAFKALIARMEGCE